VSEVRVMGPTVDEFLKDCEQSGDAAYGAFRSVLERLEDPTSRVEARIFLSDLQKRFSGDSASADHCFHTYQSDQTQPSWRLKKPVPQDQDSSSSSLAPRRTPSPASCPPSACSIHNPKCSILYLFSHRPTSRS
jgi:hypothetical protein